MTAMADMIEAEAERLRRLLVNVRHVPMEKRWTYESCREIAPLTLEINRLKREKNAIILAHSYATPEISFGVADFRGDSYQLSLRARQTQAKTIVVVGVVFMAETVKILSPAATVVVPDRNAGCSLADSLTGGDLRKLQARQPGATVVCYVNSSAEVKAAADVCVTSGNACAVIARLPSRRILFVPDRLMGQNLREELSRGGVEKEIITSDGTCFVHDRFSVGDITESRERHPGVKIVAHPECRPEVVRAADFTGSTEAMMTYVKTTPAPCFRMLTECGLVARLEVEAPGRAFVGACRRCPHMKLNTLEKVHRALAAPLPDQVIRLDEKVRQHAARGLERMFELAATRPETALPRARPQSRSSART